MSPIRSVVICGLALALGVAEPAQAEKSGKSTFQVVEQENVIVQKFPDGLYMASGTHKGVFHNKSGDGIADNMAYECSVFFDIPDLIKGVVAAAADGCILRDRDGDAIFTKIDCSIKSWEDWCGGKIVGGSGKYAGISGTTRYRRDGPFGYRRSCIASPKPEDCKTFYGSSGQVPVGTTYGNEGQGTAIVEWEWRIP